tara:strand:+ start:156 stop:527 length:372 start_codon:yes stop_codon:yes gene_type:complete
LIIKVVFIAAGGSIGAILRFLISNYCKYYFPNLPVGTLIVNVIGSFLIGLFVSYLDNKNISDLIIKYFLIIGLLGSFTTFSTFAIEVLELFKQNNAFFSLIYIMFSIILSVFAAYLGITLLKY